MATSKDHIKHLNQVLRAIRNVNQLITTEKDREQLIKKSCKLLVETRGYHNAWIVLLDKEQNYLTSAESGLGDTFEQLVDILKKEKFTKCSRLALQKNKFIVTKNPENECKDCPLAEHYTNRGAYTVPLSYEGEIYGILSTSIPKAFISDEEEQNLFHEISGDLSFALSHIDAEQKRQQAEKALKESEENLRITFNSIGDAVITTDVEGNITRMNPVAEKLTAWKAVEAIGKPLEAVFQNCNALNGKEAKNPAERVLDTGKVVGLANHTKLIAKNGIEYQISDSASPIKSDNETITGTVLVFRDITEQYKTQQKITESQQLLESTLNAIPDAICVLDNNYNVIRYNQAGYDLLGKKPEETYGKKCYELINRGKPCKVCAVKQSYHSKKIEQIERFESGLNIWVNLRAYPILDEEGNVVKMIEHFQDITYRKENEQKLEKWAQVFKHAEWGIVLGDAGGTTLEMMNPAFSRMHGYTVDELTGAPILSVFAAEERPRVKDEIAKAHRKGHHTFESKHIRKDGSIFPVIVDITTVKNTEGTVQYRIVNVQDITEQKHSEEIQSVLYSISQEAHYILNIEDLILLIKEEVSRLIDTTNFYIVLYDEESEKLTLPFFSDEKDHFIELPEKGTLTHYVINTGKSLLADKAEIDELKTRGEIEQHGSEPALWLGVPIHVKGIVTGAIVVQSYDNKQAYSKKDMHILEMVSGQIGVAIERKKSEEKLHSALAKAQESDRLKSAFLANMSHEIRTPLNGILGFTEIIQDPNLTEQERAQYNEIINKGGDRLMNTIDSLIDISKIEAGQAELKQSWVDINEMIEELRMFFGLDAEKKGLQLNATKALPDNKAITLTDKEKLYAVLSNLIKNAIKYTHEGKITFGYQYKQGILEFFVKDTGIGVCKERQQAIFNRFEQADISDTRAFEGSGLGLAISKGYLELLEGQIWLESEEGKGSTFFFSIPYITEIQKPNQLANPVKASKQNIEGALENITILITDDEEDTTIYFSKLLKKHCKKLLFAQTGTQAVDMHLQNPDINLILMDIKLPGIDGFQATREIRKYNQSVVIIAQTAYALEGDRKKALEAGCDDYITKPIKKEHLFKILLKHISNTN